jgi:hypothetical protein
MSRWLFGNPGRGYKRRPNAFENAGGNVLLGVVDVDRRQYQSLRRENVQGRKVS